MGKKIEITKENCIATTHPQIAAQWHPTLNGELTPNDVREGSTDRVWWLCDRGHEWQTEVRCRCQRNNGCPCCNGRYVIKGETDLESQRPDLVKEWDFEKNGDYTPDKASIHSPRKVGWICSKGHKWIATVEKRTQRNQGCPYCSGRRAIPGETDIVTTNPELMSLWDYEKNSEEGIYPENIKSGSDVKTWWKCENGHSWQTRTKHIAIRKQGCPYCINHKIISGENDFKTLAPPGLLAQWDYKKNTVSPQKIALRYSKPVWWKCERGHEWKCSPDSRFKHLPFTQCPYCIGQHVIKGETDLETKFPEVLEDFNYKRNRKKPDEIHWGTPKKVWWRCHVCGYEWRCGVANRTKVGTGCPRCNGKVR
jgi:hypothetical protein